MSENANSALADLTVRNVLDFLGAGRDQTSAGGQDAASGQMKPEVQEEATAAKTGIAWKDAYINFSYIERGNQLCNSEGLMDYYYDLVFRLQDGQLVLTDAGYYGMEDNSARQFDENGEPIYQYQWNGEQITKEEYSKALNAVYDQSRAVPCYNWNQLYSAEELIAELSR